MGGLEAREGRRHELSRWCSRLSPWESASLPGGVNNQVLHYDGATGAFKGTFVGSGSGGLSAARGVAVGPDGNLYVASSGATNQVLRYDGVTGAFIDVFSTGHPAAIGAIAFGPDGNLYGAVTTANVVFKVNGTTGAWIGYIGAGSPLTYAIGIAFGPDGNLYVGSFTGNQVLRFDGTTGALLGGIPAADPHPDGPRLLAFGPDGNLHVTCRDSNQVMQYDGTTLAFIDVFPSGFGLASPFGLVFVPAFAPTGGPAPVLGTPSGPVQGYVDTGVLKWHGIPYADEPVRWHRPLRRAVSTATIDATGFGPQCPQGTTTSTSGSEDCLSVSIWRAETPPVTPLPVLVYIHGGGLSGGSRRGQRRTVVTSRSSRTSSWWRSSTGWACLASSGWRN